MLFVGTSIIHPSTEGVFLLCNILDLLIYRIVVVFPTPPLLLKNVTTFITPPLSANPMILGSLMIHTFTVTVHPQKRGKKTV